MLNSIPVGAKVICTDGPKGKSTAVIVDRQSKKVTHIAFVEDSILRGEERLVPIEKVVKTTRDEIHLNCSSKEVLEMPAFTRTHYMEIEDETGYSYSAPYMTMHSDMSLSPEIQYTTYQDQLVPEGEVAIQRGMLVEALDGPVGQVGELLIDPGSGQVTHFLLMKGHHWGKKEIAIAISEIERGDQDTIYLKIDKARIQQLPSLPVNRTWNEVYATDLELMVWTYEQKDAATRTLQQVEALSQKYAMELLNTTILEKDEKGNVHVHEQKNAPTKRRVAFGVALGGLAGLAIGPVALVAGAIAGAVAGKKSEKKVEVGFSQEKSSKLNESLVPGGSALIVLVEHRWFHMLQLETAESGGNFIHERLSDIAGEDLANPAGEEKDA